jgi:hypothetical protein
MRSSLASGPPISLVTPVSASLIPSMSPSEAAEACSVDVRKLGRTAVAISWPESEKKLVNAMLRTPGDGHRPRVSPDPAGSTFTA